MFRKRPTVTLPRVLNVGFVFGNPTLEVFCFPYVKLPTPFALEDIDHIFGNTSEVSPVFPQIFLVFAKTKESAWFDVSKPMVLTPMASKETGRGWISCHNMTRYSR